LKASFDHKHFGPYHRPPTMRPHLLVALFFSLIFTQASAFYLPGAAPRDYKSGEEVELDVNVLKPGLGYEKENLASSSSV